MRSLLPALVLLLAVGPSSGARDGGDAERPTWELPEVPAAKVARLASEAEPWSRPFRDWPGDLSEPGWDRIEPWTDWAELLRAEAESEQPKPLRRAELARVAAATGRHGDAWAHFEACASDPAVAAAILPVLFPGVPQDATPGAPLPSGVVLRPLLPPPIERLPHGSFDPASIGVTGLRVGDAVLGIRLELARDGVQVDVTHLSGGTAELALVVPAPEGWHSTIEYLDWDRLEDVGRPRVVRSSDESEEEASHALWGRFAPLPPHWPGLGAADPKALLERIRRVGIAIEAAPALEARACGLGFALRALFDVPVSERPPGTRRGPDGVGPTVLRLREDDGVEGLRTLMSLAERLALSH